MIEFLDIFLNFIEFLDLTAVGSYWPEVVILRLPPPGAAVLLWLRRGSDEKFSDPAKWGTGPEQIPNGSRTDPERIPNEPRTEPERTPYAPRTES